MSESPAIRIGIDATPMLVAHRTGVEQYAAALVQELASISKEDPGFELFVYLHGGNPFASSKRVKETIELLAASDVAWRLYTQRRAYGFALPVYAWMDRLDLMHFLRPTSLHVMPCSYVVTVHDVRSVGLSEEGRRQERANITPSEEKAIFGATGISADSFSAQADLLTHFGQDFSVPVEIIPLGVDPIYYTARSQAETIRSKYALDQFVLFVGALQYRKNLPALIEAFALVKKEFAIPHKLVLAGRDGWGAEQVYAAVKNCQVEDDVLFPGYIPDDDLPGLYAAADLFAYPSLHEGFGIPILEAMAAGTVVLTSNLYSMSEVAGDAAILIDPHNVTSIAAGLRCALTDDASRYACQIKGTLRAQEFTWRQTALRTLALYRKMAKRR